MILLTHLTGFYNYYSSGGSISCLNIWNSNLTLREMLVTADCGSQGDVYHLAEDTIDLYGNVTSFTLNHPDYLSQTVAGKLILTWTYPVHYDVLVTTLQCSYLSLNHTI